VSVPFEIVEILGQGTFGTVAVARDLERGGQLVAVKIVKTALEDNPQVLQRARDEARLLSHLSHPNIVRVHRLAELCGRPTVVMELVGGVSLAGLILAHRRGLPTLVAMEAVRRTALALDYAWSATHGADVLQVVHRDIKPSNVILSTEGVFKVVDFGIARGRFAGRETRTDSLVMGSRPYMAPERLDGRDTDPSVDVYSLGVMLFELLTGKPLAPSVNPAVHAKNLSVALSHLTMNDLPPHNAAAVVEVIRAACAYEPRERPTAHNIARTLNNISRGAGTQLGEAVRRFASDVVKPLHQNRPKVAPLVAAKSMEDGLFLAELIRGPQPKRQTTPQIFVGAIALTVAFLSMASVHKAAQPVVPGPTVMPVAGEPVTVGVWMPSDVTVSAGDQHLEVPGRLTVPTGPAELDVRYSDGEQYRCGFLAQEDAVARVVWQRQGPALAVDDGPAVQCDLLTPNR